MSEHIDLEALLARAPEVLAYCEAASPLRRSRPWHSGTGVWCVENVAREVVGKFPYERDGLFLAGAHSDLPDMTRGVVEAMRLLAEEQKERREAESRAMGLLAMLNCTNTMWTEAKAERDYLRIDCEKLADLVNLADAERKAAERERDRLRDLAEKLRDALRRLSDTVPWEWANTTRNMRDADEHASKVLAEADSVLGDKT